MKALAVVSKGLEGIASKEIKELINAESEIKDSCVLFEIDSPLDLCRLCYSSQSIDRVLFLFDFFDFKDDMFDKINSAVEKADFKEWIGKTTKFRVRCQRIGSHDFSSQEVEENAGEMIIGAVKRKLKFTPTVDLNEPDVSFFIYICNSSCYAGIDFSGFDMHKRNYTLFTHPRALRATIAYSLVRIAEYKEGEVLLDPMACAGTIPIEAALHITKFPVNYYYKDKFAFLKFRLFKKTDFEEFFQEIDNQIKKIKTEIYCYDPLLRNLYASKKNAKIAGIEGSINFSRADIEWLDTKFKEKSADKIITSLPLITQISQKDNEKIYNELFYQAEYILKKGGKIVAVSNNDEILRRTAEKHSFKITETKEVWSGKQPIKIFLIAKFL